MKRAGEEDKRAAEALLLPSMATSGGLDRRARKRAATRQAIVQAAQQLFADRGYGSVTVLEIAEAADVGARTFYRHFAGKEVVALDHLRRFLADGVAACAGRPSGEHPVDSIRAALEQLSESDYEEGLLSEILLVETVPEVAGVQHHLLVAAQDRLTAVFAERLGATMADLEPRLLAIATTAVIHTALQTWWQRHRESIPSPTVWELGRQALAGLEPGLRAIVPHQESRRRS